MFVVSRICRDRTAAIADVLNGFLSDHKVVVRAFVMKSWNWRRPSEFFLLALTRQTHLSVVGRCEDPKIWKKRWVPSLSIPKFLDVLVHESAGLPRPKVLHPPGIRDKGVSTSMEVDHIFANVASTFVTRYASCSVGRRQIYIFAKGPQSLLASSHHF